MSGVGASPAWLLVLRDRLRAAGPCLGFRRLGNRGVAAVIFGISATVVIGTVGLGTEAGAWYLTRRNAQDAADPAAYAGAMRLSLAQSLLSLPLAAAQTQAIAAATDTATRNGFTTGPMNTTVTVNTPPTTGSQAGNITAVEVIVERSPPRLISALFLGADPVIRTRGVAALTSLGEACLLGGIATPVPEVGLTMGGNTNVQASNCVLASNATGDSSIDIFGSATVNSAGLVTAGGCNGCTGTYSAYAPPTTNPFAYLDSKVLPTFDNTSCINSNNPGSPLPKNGSVTSSITLAPPPAGKAICALHVSGNSTVVTLLPGTYYFYNASFDIQSGSVICPTCAAGNGVTLVFTGNNAGGPQINANAVVDLTAGSASDPDYATVLFFRDPKATSGNQGNPPVQINGGTDTELTGGMYFPNAYVKYNGSANVSQCSILAGGTIELTGTSGLSTAGCDALGGGFGNLPPMTQTVRLVE